MKEKLYVVVDADTLEIWANEFGGELPPMTEQQIKNYFWDCDIEKIKKKHSIVLYKLDEKHLCRHCLAPLAKSDTKGYKWQCFYCNEDFYDCEVIKKTR